MQAVVVATQAVALQVERLGTCILAGDVVHRGGAATPAGAGGADLELVLGVSVAQTRVTVELSKHDLLDS